MSELEVHSGKRKFDQTDGADRSTANKKTKIGHIGHIYDIFSFPDLPPEIQYYILRLISNDHQRRHARLVCRNWFDIINYNEFKIGVLLASEADEFYRIFSRYESPISLKFMKIDYLNSTGSFKNDNLITLKQLEHALKQMTQLTALDLQVSNFELSNHMTNLQALTSLCPIRESIFTNLTRLTRLKTSKILKSTQKYPSSLEALEFNSVAFQTTYNEPITQLTELKTAMISTDFLNTLPNLRKLDICRQIPRQFFYGKLAPIEHLEKLVTNIDAPQLFGSNLTSLKYLQDQNDPPIQPFKITSNLVNLKKLSCDVINLPEENCWALLNLESCASKNTASIINYLNPDKIRQLTIQMTKENIGQLVKFTKLTDLTLTTMGSLPFISFNMSLLTKLHLVHNNNPSQLLYQLPNLVDLSILNCASEQQYVASEPITFANFHRLTALKIAGHYNYIIMKNLPSLQSLQIDNKYRAIMKPSLDINELSTLTSLTSLKFAYITKKYRALTRWSDLALLTNLRELVILQDHSGDIENLTTLHKLTYLDIASNGLSVESLAKLSRLQSIDLQTDLVGKTIANVISTQLLFCHTFKIH